MKKRYGRTMYSGTGTSAAAAIVTIICGILFILRPNAAAGAAVTAAGLIMLCITMVLTHKRKETARSYLQILSQENGTMSSNFLGRLPIPMTVVNVDGTIKWYNDKFSQLFDERDMFGSLLETVIKDIKWSDILKSASFIDKHIKIGEKEFCMTGSMIKDKNTSAAGTEDKYLAYIYFIDETELHRLEKLYRDEKTAVAIISIDNYDEVLQRVNDNEQQQINSQIRGFINSWAAESSAVVKKIERDRYFMFFENKYLTGYIDRKFNILDNVRNISESIKIPVSVSIGIGVGGTISENESYARSALDMTLGRGGDQVCIKDEGQYKFYGGKSKEYEKSTRVKTRVVAVALKDFIKNSDKVIFMGHSNADYDCLGAAMGLQRAVKTLGKKPYIIYDGNSPAIKDWYNELRVIPEYREMFIDAENAIEEITPDTLLVILDTHRPSMLPAPELLKHATRVVLIDHHRRSTEFINPCSLIYHEPYASSTCEMATELLEYMDLGGMLTSEEAECLYTGILMDTKNFFVKTGVRTFEAASYLRRLGLNTIDVKKHFNINKKDYDHKVDIVKTASEIAPNIAVAKCYEKFENNRVIASQAADEMLNINNIRASFVVYQQENGIGICARSLGGINVQLIMESLGGGGHMTVAGAQVRGETVDDVVSDVKAAVHAYLKEIKQ